jgi:hypothetical protein
MTDPDAVMARLQDERERAAALLASLSRDFTGMVEASADSNADDEHDPEGSTIAFERSQVSTLIEQARARLDEIDAATGRRRHLRRLRGVWRADSSGTPRGASRGPHLHGARLRARGNSAAPARVGKARRNRL